MSKTTIDTLETELFCLRRDMELFVEDLQSFAKQMTAIEFILTDILEVIVADRQDRKNFPHPPEPSAADTIYKFDCSQ